MKIVFVVLLAGVTPAIAATSAIRVPVPGVRQATDYTCGTATTIAVLQRHGVGDDLNEKQHAQRMGTNHRTGTEPVQIARYLRGYGIVARVKNHMTLQKLQRALDREQPVYLHLQAWADNPSIDYARTNANGHWVLAIGYDAHRVLFMDPWIGGARGELSNAELERRWHGVDDQKRPRFDHLGIVVDSKLPVVNTASYSRTEPIR